MSSLSINDLNTYTPNVLKKYNNNDTEFLKINNKIFKNVLNIEHNIDNLQCDQDDCNWSYKYSINNKKLCWKHALIK
jgi:hypothetical protein